MSLRGAKSDLCECEREKAAVLEHDEGMTREDAEYFAPGQFFIRSHCEDWPTCKNKEL